MQSTNNAMVGSYFKTSGFTLVEIVIVVAIVAIIAAIALPSYQNQVQKSRRADAMAALMQARQAMERHYNKYYSYADAAAGTTFPDKSPIDGSNVYYNLSLTTSLAGTAFSIRATPAGPQTGDPCGVLSINHAGQKGAKGNTPQTTAMADIDECWR